MEAIKIDRGIMRNLVEGRKMAFEDFIKNQEGISTENGNIQFDNFAVLQKVSDKLSVPIKDFFGDDDLNDGVKIGRKSKAFSRTVSKKGTDYYTYNHLVTTKVEPNLMALRVDLHCREKDKITLNAGHDSKELVYVTKGKVRVDWEGKNGEHHDVLDVGDSIYVYPGIRHSFIALENNSEIIAINY